jgi:hypothetical protein
MPLDEPNDLTSIRNLDCWEQNNGARLDVRFAPAFAAIWRGKQRSGYSYSRRPVGDAGFVCF